MVGTISCPYCRHGIIYNDTSVCPNCGYLVCEIFKQINYQYQANGSQAINNVPVQTPDLQPTMCKIKKLKNVYNRKSSLNFFKYSFLEISYNMLLILGKDRITDNKYLEEGVFSNYDEAPDAPDIGIIGGLILTAIDIGAAAIGAALTPSTDFKLVIGLRPEHVRNLTFRPLNKGGVNMIVEMYDGNLIEISSNQECYNKVNAWWQNNRFQNKIT